MPEDEPKKPVLEIVVDSGQTGARIIEALSGEPIISAPLDPVAAEPTMVGRAGRAWSIDLEAARANLGGSHDNDATIAAWLVEAPWAHPAWHSYEIILVHLRPTVSGPEPSIAIPGATHEFWIFASDPRCRREEVIKGNIIGSLLTPMNFGAQFIAADDAHAIQRVREQAVRPILDGAVSPDTDFIHQWTALWNDSLLKKR